MAWFIHLLQHDQKKFLNYVYLYSFLARKEFADIRVTWYNPDYKGDILFGLPSHQLDQLVLQKSISSNYYHNTILKARSKVKTRDMDVRIFGKKSEMLKYFKSYFLILVDPAFVSGDQSYGPFES